MSDVAQVVEKAAEKVAQHVITSENREAFMQKRLDLVAPEVKIEAKPEAKEEGKPEVKVETKLEDEALADEKKVEPDPKKQKLNQRFSELTEKRKAAEAEVKKERDLRIAAENKARDLELKLNPPAQDVLKPKPEVSQFKDAFEYAEALSAWAAEKAVRERDEKEQEARANAERERMVAGWKERLDATKNKIPDYEEKVSASAAKVSEQVRDAILESDLGPRILYHFAEHPEEADRIGKLTVPKALIELGKLEVLLTQPGKKTIESPKVEISKAPEPISALRGASSPAEVPIDTKGEFTGSYQEWKALRKARKIH